MPYLVREHLFIGNIGDAVEILQNGSNDITHMLSVLSSASISFFSEWRSGLSIPSKEIRKVYAGDSGSEDASGNGSNSHCPQISSYTHWSMQIVGNRDLFWFTALLVYQGDAIESLRESCETVCPNDGFLDQLKMFEQMGFKVDRASPIYKRFRLKVLGDSYNRGEKIDGSKYGADPGLTAEKDSTNIEASPSPAYRCKKCRRLVALQENVLDHVPGEGDMLRVVQLIIYLILVEEGALEGKLSCAHCEARLGYFNWSGIQCSCGSWITPAFQLHKSRVDISTV
ncbi:Dual specificity protein phosphatase 12 [Sesamum angolense]|uniref:protein-tyrosine-phosphatase n=1 Tax=Sesamum angolense TaxID=2727404 RepID=A0AAE1X3N2_9LAMI|nr:Dual specificity protein phosphatase 12 [Sesamum angolense]